MQKQQATNAPVDAPVVKVIGQGTLDGSGYPFLLVTSASELGRVHVCAYAYEGVEVGSRMTCDCMAGQFGKSCKHVLVARAWLAGFSSVSRHTPNAPVAPDVQPQSQLNRTRGFSLMK